MLFGRLFDFKIFVRINWIKDLIFVVLVFLSIK